MKTILLIIGVIVILLNQNLPQGEVKMTIKEDASSFDKALFKTLTAPADWEVRNYVLFKTATTNNFLLKEYTFVAIPFVEEWYPW